MAEHSFDSIIVGSGAGGAACAYRLTRAGQRVLVLEKGPRLVRDASTLDPQRVVGEGQFKSRETWRDGRGREVVPEEYFNLGGKTKWYGAALVRFGDRELEAEPELGAPAFPLDAAELASYYAEAERLLGVRVFERERDLARITQGLEPHGWRARPLSMGLNSAIVGHADEATHFDGFASPKSPCSIGSAPHRT